MKRAVDTGRAARVQVDIEAMSPSAASRSSSSAEFQYESIRSPFPISSYLGTVEVFSSYDGLGVVAWTVDFESEPEMSGPVAALLEGAIGGGVEGMDTDLSDLAA